MQRNENMFIFNKDAQMADHLRPDFPEHASYLDESLSKQVKTVVVPEAKSIPAKEMRELIEKIPKGKFLP